MADLTGVRFNRLVGIRRGSRTPGLYWWFRCDCGTEKEMMVANVRHGRSQSCGCLHKAQLAALRLTHGLTRNYQPRSNAR